MCLLCLSAHAPKTYGSQFCVLVILYVCNSDYLEVTINSALESTVWAQHDNISYLVVLVFQIKALFFSYGMTYSPQTLLWHVAGFPGD